MSGSGPSTAEAAGHLHGVAETTPRAKYMAPMCAALGMLSHGIFNSMRKRPAMYQPWWHAVLGAGGFYFGSWLGRLYDDTSDELNRQYAGSARLPSWMQGRLSEGELELERRRETAAELRRKWNELARLEEAEYMAAGRGNADVQRPPPPPTPEEVARMKERRQRSLEAASAEARNTMGPDSAPLHFR